MRSCARCGKGYRGEPPYCDVCAEFKAQVRREEQPALFCRHCGRRVSGPGDAHLWTVKRRTGELPGVIRRRE